MASEPDELLVQTLGTTAQLARLLGHHMNDANVGGDEETHKVGDIASIGDKLSETCRVIQVGPGGSGCGICIRDAAPGKDASRKGMAGVDVTYPEGAAASGRLISLPYYC